MVGFEGAKMSKSRGNLVLVSRLRADGVDPMAIRLVLLGRHYRTDWEYTADLLEAAQARLHRWREALSVNRGADAATHARGGAGRRGRRPRHPRRAAPPSTPGPSAPSPVEWDDAGGTRAGGPHPRCRARHPPLSTASCQRRRREVFRSGDTRSGAALP